MALDTLVLVATADIAVLAMAMVAAIMGVSNSQFQQQIATKVSLHRKLMTQTFLQLLIDFAAVISQTNTLQKKNIYHDATGYAGSHGGE